MRTLYALNSAWRLKRGHFAGPSSRDYWQAGKSVSGIASIEPAGEIVRRFGAALRGASPVRRQGRSRSTTDTLRRAVGLVLRAGMEPAGEIVRRFAAALGAASPVRR